MRLSSAANGSGDDDFRDAIEAGSGEFTLEEIVENWITLLGNIPQRDSWVTHEGCFVRLRNAAHTDAISEAVHFHRPSDAEAFADWVLGKLRLENVKFEHLRRI